MKLKSPLFNYRINTGDLAAAAIYTKNYENTTENEASHSPFNSLVIDNFSGQKLKVSYNGHEKTIRPNSCFEIDDYGIRQFVLTNVGSIANDDQIEITICKKVTLEHIAIAQLTGLPIQDVIDGKGW